MVVEEQARNVLFNFLAHGNFDVTISREAHVMVLQSSRAEIASFRQNANPEHEEAPLKHVFARCRL